MIMGAFKPQVTYMTRDTLHDYNVDRLRCYSPYKTQKFNTYAELKKVLKNYILLNHIGDKPVMVTRSRRGEWGEWFELWQLVNCKPKIIKQGWQ